ncbi:unnamed protein product [Diabrotica balteata]|uniref:Alkylated DNA repair protein AlkB homologue 8 N-terminal domain-containing protein n=1 Tax=Diabrotica balteata TaxID=107213 RepID=A0A9N9STE8_DIABA|nr:unnamed protein product [Diabrotica balteata]
MVISKKHTQVINILVNNNLVEQVKKFKYLGHWIHETLDQEQEKCRIEQARNSFLKMRQLLTTRNLDLSLRYRMIKCYVYSVLLHGVEAWTLTVSSLRHLESFEMWVFRRMLKTSWTDRVRNEEVLRRMNREREPTEIVKKRKTSYLGHIFRHDRYNFLQLIIEGKI